MSKCDTEPRTSDLSLTAILYALSDETRLQMVDTLAEAEYVDCGSFDVDAPKSSLSYHFRVLVSSGIIGRKKVGTAIHNRLRREDLNERFPGLLDAVLEARRNSA
ncbi:ArsR family transcriptional regulator [bacterium]|nr:MAG: ArsR family transcriptional regulator [bacterium]